MDGYCMSGYYMDGYCLTGYMVLHDRVLHGRVLYVWAWTGTVCMGMDGTGMYTGRYMPGTVRVHHLVLPPSSVHAHS